MSAMLELEFVKKAIEKLDFEISQNHAWGYNNKLIVTINFENTKFSDIKMNRIAVESCLYDHIRFSDKYLNSSISINMKYNEVIFQVQKLFNWQSIDFEQVLLK